MRVRTTLAAACACVAAGNAAAQAMPEFRFSGFGTLAVVHSSEDQADYVSSLFQPTGAGYTDKYAVSPDTKLGVQGDVKFGDRFSAVVQIVSQQRYDKTYLPRLEWGNVKWQATDELSLRLGRIVLPTFLISESRLVGYANPWLRTPIEFYNLSPVTSNDGADATWRTTFGGVNNTLQGYYGRIKVKSPGGLTVKADKIYGLADTVELGSLTLHGAYQKVNADLESANLDMLFAGFGQFAAGAAAVPVPAFQAAAAQATALASKYDGNNLKLGIATIGASYDPGNWFVMAEYGHFDGDGFISTQNAWYVSAGWRFGSVTPYATYSKLKNKRLVEAGISTVGAAPLAAGAAALNGGLNAVLQNSYAAQSSAIVGVRWDFYKNVALKAQYDRVDVGSDSKGRFTNVQPGFVPGGKANVYSVGLDFVF